MPGRVWGRMLKDYDLPYVLKTTDPTASDTGYPTPSLWVNTSSNKIWFHYGSGTWEQIFTPETAFSNTDIDAGTETVDSFADTAGRKAVWSYVLDNADTNIRAGTIEAAWDKTADSTPVFFDDATEDIGHTSGEVFTVDKSGNTVRLRCAVSSDNWAVYGKRTLIG